MFNKLKKIIKKNSFIKFMYYLIFDKRKLQKKMSFGELNKSKVIYIIRPNSEDGVQGLMSLFVQTMRKIDYANKKGYIPFVDFKNFKTQYYDGINNSWEWFFTQPSDLKIEDVYKSKNVIFSGVSIIEHDNPKLFKKNIFFDKYNLKYCNQLVKKNVSLSNEIQVKMDIELKKIDPNKCIGVYIRGTDYVNLKPIGEYVQPTIDELIKKLDEYLDIYKDFNVFLVTEDASYYNILRKKYEKKLVLVSYDSFISNYNGKDFLSKSNVLNKDLKKRGQDYLIKLMILSKCKVLISSITYGSIAMYSFNEDYEKDTYIFDLGQYK